MKTIRLLYPDYLSGGVETYWFGANLLVHLLPENKEQKVIRVDIAPPDEKERAIKDGIYAKDEVLEGVAKAKEAIAEEKPERIITAGGNCIVSLAPFDYLHGLYQDAGIIWLDAHPDVSLVENGYPNAHAMVLGALLGRGEESLVKLMDNTPFKPDDLLYIGLQDAFDYQQKFLDEAGVKYRLQKEEFVPDEEIRRFLSHHKHILIHFDIDVLDARFFHSTWFANPALTGDGSGGGRMTMEELSRILSMIFNSSDVVGFTIAEYLPFDEEKLHRMLEGLGIFKGR